ncbi:MAG: TrmH family RNA methyltransferase [Treponema sp.]|nr:TrmH family RNA methyltransferase [Treponema sp.]MBQ5645850.1 TrmH family RNA methyltransferase [Treponema sp.]
MIEPSKLFQLSGGQKRRKLALTFGALERDIAGIPEKGMEYSFKQMSRAEYTKTITKILLQDPKLPLGAAEEINQLLNAEPFDELRLCNCARNHLLAIIGTFPAEWDLVIAPHANPYDENGVIKEREFFPGMCVYAEDIRSPFNIGSIFRTAEGMGAEKVFISPFCVDPNQSRAIRSGMGCIETMGWEQIPVEELPDDIPVFALETGGTDIEEFVFPEKGICIIGSEELGVSPQALNKATYGRVSIPMKGLKASLNVGVAFGILMQKWVEYVSKNYN